MQEEQGGGQPYITMGSIISLSHFEDKNSFIFIDGHIKQKVMVRNFSILSGKLSDEHFGVNEINNKDDSQSTKNLKFSGCLFQILPKLSDKQKEEIQMKTQSISNDDNHNSDEEESVHPISKTTSRQQSKFEFNMNSNMGSQQFDTVKEINLKMENDNDQELDSQFQKNRKKGTDLDKEKVIQLQGKLMNEFKVNYEAFEKYKHNRITYNQTIQLMHINSSKFLACYPVEAAIEKGNYRVTLDDYTSESTLFRIVPAFKYQKDGDLTIYANEIIVIERVNPFHNKKTILHSSEEIQKQKSFSFLDLPSQMKAVEQNNSKTDTVQVKLPLRIEQNSQNKKVSKREVNASTEAENDPTKWKVNLYSYYMENQQRFLRCGDVIWLHHSEANASLGALRKRELKDISQNDWHHMDSKDNLEVSIVPSDISTNLEEYSGNTCGMWILERKNFKVGGYIQFDNHYRLRHLSSGLYLSVDAPLKDISTRQNTEDHLQMKLVNIPSESSLFQFVSLENNQLNQQQKFIKSDSFVQLRHVQTKTWVDLSQNQENKPTIKKFKANSNLKSASDLNQVVDKNQQPNVLTSIRPFLSQIRSENQVFKLFSANESDVWEINFIISASKELTKLLKVISRCQIQYHSIDKENPLSSLHISPNDYQRIKFMKKKLGRLITTIKHLNEFCNNRMHNSSFDQKYGSINHYRQKLLREQYYIDILTQLLNTLFEKHEFEHLKNIDNTFSDMIERKAQIKFKINKQQRANRNSNSYTSIIRPSDEARIKFNSMDYLKYVKQKRYLCIVIYKLITSICKQNPENEQYTFNLIPLFKIQCKYVPQAIDCLISIISQNEGLLLKLSENLIIKNKEGSRNVLTYDRPCFDEIDVTSRQRGNERKKTQQFLITKNDKDNSEQPENLINYFMDLVYDQEAPLQADYYRFLSSICRYKNDGISLNQENIFKLFKSMSSNSMYSSNFVDRFKNGIQIPESMKDIEELYHQLTFLSDLSFGRNFQWLRELVKNFKFDYLLENIWKNIRTNSVISLSSCFSKLAMALYIDHYPLYRIIRPNFCRIFHDTNKQKQIQTFKAEQLQLYQGLLNNLINYLKDLSEKVELEFNNNEIHVKKDKDKDKGLLRQDTETKDQRNKQMGVQILNEDLLFQSVNMLNLLIDLDVFNIMNRKNDYESIVQYLIKIFVYDRMNIAFCSTSYFNTKKIAEQKQEDKKNALLKKFVKIDVKMDDFNIFSDDSQNEDNEEEEDENIDGIAKVSSKIDENQLYHNPLMRGYLKMNCLLERHIQNEEDGTQLEINIKLQICDLFDKLLDMRQDFLIENTIHWFYKNINNMISEQDSVKIEAIIFQGIAKIMPNIPKTGIKEIDEEYNKLKEENTFMKVLSNDNKPFYKFENFSTNSWLSISFVKSDEELQNPSYAILPYLLQSFILMHNLQLEKKCLSLMMRVFNQRQELLENLNKLEIIFDRQKAILYRIMTENIQELTKLIEQTEDWFEEFIKDDKTYDQCEPMKNVMEIIKNLKNCFFCDITFDEERLKILLDSNKKIVDPNKQKIFLYLRAYEPIIELLKDGMHHFNAIMSDISQPKKKKAMVFELFQDTYELLINFCMNNNDNQLILYESINGLLQYLHYDVGQISLLSEIFRDNISLLKEKSNRMIIQTLIDLILDYGRQHRILDFFIVFQKCNNTYIFDNQLLILNTFLPINDFGEDELKLLYSVQQQKGDRSIILDFKNEDLRDNNMSFLEYFLAKKTAKRDDTFLYHAKLLNMLLQTTYIQVLNDKIPNQLNTKQNFNISIAKLKAIDSSFLKDQLIEVDNFQIKQNDYQNQELKSPTKKSEQNILMLHNPNKKRTPSISSNILNREQQKKESEFLQKGLTYLKPFIIDFLKDVYILGESSSTYQGDGSLSMQFLERIIGSELTRVKDIQQAEDITEEYVVYMFNNIIPFLQAYQDKYLANIQQFNERDRKDLQEMRNFATELRKVIKVFDNRISQEQNQRIVEFLRDILADDIITTDIIKNQDFFMNDASYDYQYKMDSMNQQSPNKERAITINLQRNPSMPSQEVKESSQNLNLNSPNVGGIKSKTKSAFSAITNKLKSINILKQISNKTQINADVDSKISDSQLRKKWQHFLKCLNQTDDVIEEINKEKRALTEAILEVKQIIPAEVIQDIEPKPDRYTLIKKSIIFLQYAVDDVSNKNTIQVLLNVLRKVVEKCDDNQEEKQKMQNTLDQLGATRMVLYVISENHKNLDSELLSNFLEFLNTLLDGGNVKVQKTLYEYYISHQKSEMIFKRFDQIIRKQIQSIEAIVIFYYPLFIIHHFMNTFQYYILILFRLISNQFQNFYFQNSFIQFSFFSIFIAFYSFKFYNFIKNQ